MENSTRYYLDKVENTRRIKFMWFFSVPKDRLVFILSTVLSFSILNHIIRSPWVSVMGIYILWEYGVILSTMIKIAEECAKDECFMEVDLRSNEELKNTFPGDPLYVTEDDRKEITEKFIVEMGNVSFYNKLKNHHFTLVIAAVFYFSMYFLLGLF